MDRVKKQGPIKQRRQESKDFEERFLELSSDGRVSCYQSKNAFDAGLPPLEEFSCAMLNVMETEGTSDSGLWAFCLSAGGGDVGGKEISFACESETDLIAWLAAFDDATRMASARHLRSQYA